MKTAKLMSVLCVAAIAMVGCSSTSTDTTSPGAMGAKKDGCCSDAKAGACTDSKAKSDAAGSMGAVSEKKTGCCSGEKKTN